MPTSRTTLDFLRLHERRRPSKVAVVDESSSRTYGALADRVWSLARALRKDGIRPGDTVGILADNTIFCAEAYLGACAAGAIAVLYNWRWAPPELAFAVNHSHPAVVLLEDSWRSLYEEAESASDGFESVRRVVHSARLDAYLVPGGPVDDLPRADDASSMLYTGGTTGFPKGAVLSHRNVVVNALNEIIDTDMHQADRTLLITPMFHAASLFCWFVPHIVLGATSVFMRTFDEDRMGATIASQQITNGFLIPSMVRRLLAAGTFGSYDMSSYERLYVGAAAFRMPDKEAVRDALPGVAMYYQYGLTEGGPIVTRLRPEDQFRPDIDGSIGQEFLYSETSVRDLVTDELVAPGVTGELCVRGPNVMMGYFEDEAATKHALRNGWMHTGDIVSRNAEGYMFFEDRSKDMIKSGGENVYSAEVERVLYAHPAVQEIAVIGIPGEKWDEEVCAVVVLRPGSSASAEELTAHCRMELAGYKIPKRYAFVGRDALPINQSGKIMKARVREMGLF